MPDSRHFGNFIFTSGLASFFYNGARPDSAPSFLSPNWAPAGKIKAKQFLLPLL